MKPVIPAVVVFLLLAAGAAAEGPKGACKADVEKFCKDVKPGEGRIIACLKTHEAELSAECKAKGLEAKGPEAKDRKEGKGGFIEACRADLDKLCAGVPAGHGAKIRCLKEHEAVLSEGCKAGLDKAKEKMDARREGKKGHGGGKTESSEDAPAPQAPPEGK